MRSHNNDHSTKSSKALLTVFLLNLSFTVLELVGGYWTNSVAILSDAVHDLGDSLAIGAAFYLSTVASKAADSRYSYGYGRYNVLGAVVNSIVLMAGSIFVLKEAVERLIEPAVVDAKGMIIFAVLGVTVNGFAAYRLRNASTLNERVKSLHETHTWSIDGETHVFSTHLVVDPSITLKQIKHIKLASREVLRGYPFSSHTVEVEFDGEEDHNLLF